MTNVLTNILAFYFKWKSTKLFYPFLDVCDKGRIYNSADVVFGLEPSNMNGNDTIIDSYWTTALSRKSAYSVANLKTSRIDKHDSILSSETVLVKPNLHSFLI